MKSRHALLDLDLPESHTRSSSPVGLMYTQFTVAHCASNVSLQRWGRVSMCSPGLAPEEKKRTRMMCIRLREALKQGGAAPQPMVASEREDTLMGSADTGREPRGEHGT